MAPDVLRPAPRDDPRRRRRVERAGRSVLRRRRDGDHRDRRARHRGAGPTARPAVRHADAAPAAAAAIDGRTHDFRSPTSNRSRARSARPPAAIGVLMIGDSILASAAPRNSDRLCDALSLFGWDVEIDAEPGHDPSFVTEVLDARFGSGVACRPIPSAGDTSTATVDGRRPAADRGRTVGRRRARARQRGRRHRPRTGRRVHRRRRRPDRPGHAVADRDLHGHRDRRRSTAHQRPPPRPCRRVIPNVVVLDWADLGGDIDIIVDATVGS